MAPGDRKPALLGIDVGTSSVKVLLEFLVGGDAGPVPPRVARSPVRVRRAPDGTSEVSPGDWWRAIVRAMRALEHGDAHVLGIGPSTLFPALVAVDGRGRPVRPAILYDDRRSAPEVQDLERTPLAHPALVHLLTGNRVRPGTISLSSLLWLRRHEPKAFERARLFGHASSYVGWRLTGRFALDATNASLTGLYATASGEAWLRGVCRAAGLALDRSAPAAPKAPESEPGFAAAPGMSTADPRPAGAAPWTYGRFLDLVAGGRPDLRDQVLADVPAGAAREALLAQPLDLLKGGWVEALCDAVGLDRSRLPEVVWPTDRLGPLSAEAAEALGLEPGTPVAAGAGDAACGAFGLGLASEDEVAAVCGSTDCLIAYQGAAVFSSRVINMAYMDDRTWLAAAPMNATGSAVDWLAGALAGRGRRRFERFFGLAERAPVGSKGVVFLPYLAGERSPVYDPSARGVFFGLALDTGPAEMARAVLEGIGFGHRQVLQMTDVRLGGPVERVIASGGGVAHPLARQARADAADRPYRFADVTDVSALGAAYLGGVAAGVFGSWREAAAAARRRLRLADVQPSPGAWHRLKRNFEVYAGLYGALKDCFHL
jgi:sugar (pentulose or hexulose) kinase